MIIYLKKIWNKIWGHTTCDICGGILYTPALYDLNKKWHCNKCYDY